MLYKRHNLLKQNESRAVAVTIPEYARVFSGNAATLQEVEGLNQRAVAIWLSREEQEEIEAAFNQESPVQYQRSEINVIMHPSSPEESDQVVGAVTFIAHPVAFAMQMIDEDDLNVGDDVQRELDFMQNFASIDQMHVKIRDLPDTAESIDIEVREAGSLELVKTVPAISHVKRVVEQPQPVPVPVPEPAPVQMPVVKEIEPVQAAPVEEVKREPFDLEAKIKEMDDAFLHMQSKAMKALGPMNAAMM